MSSTGIPLLDTPRNKKERMLALALCEAEVKRRLWARDPVKWAQEKLGDTIWSGQQRILRAIRDHRKVAVATAHGVGKSFGASEIAGWWIDTHKAGEAFVVTTAPTAPQVRVIL